jgi:hypothetical protein
MSEELVEQHPVEPHERFRLHGADPADIATATDEAADRVTAILDQLREPWMDDAACRTVDTAVFFARNPSRALTVCGACPVLLDCREFAITTDTIADGVFGGMDPPALRQARRTRQAASSIHSYSQQCRCDDCRRHRADTTRRWRSRTGRTGPS